MQNQPVLVTFQPNVQAEKVPDISKAQLSIVVHSFNLKKNNIFYSSHLQITNNRQISENFFPILKAISSAHK